MQANLAFEWEVHRNTSLTATYLFVDGADLPRSIDRNLGSSSVRTFTVAGSGATYPYHFFGADRPFTNFTRVIGFEASAESRYHGITFELNRRMSNHLQYRAAYTLGKVEDTVPDATAVVPGNAGDDVKYASNPVNFDADRTAGNNDQRHRLVLSGIYDTIGVDRLQGFMGTLVRNWSFSVIFTAQSGQPYTARVGAVDLNGDGNTRNDIAPGTVRNQFRLSSLVTFDPRIAREIPIGPARAAAHLGGVQPLQPRQHQRRRYDLLQRRGHDADQFDDVRTPALEQRRTDHAARGEDHVLDCQLSALSSQLSATNLLNPEP